QQGQAHGGVLEAQVPGDHGSPGHRDLGVLAQLRRTQRCRFEQDPDRGVSPAYLVFCRGKRHPGKLGALAAVALGECQSSWRSATTRITLTSAIRSIGPGLGPPTAESCTTARPAIRPAIRTARIAS